MRKRQNRWPVQQAYQKKQRKEPRASASLPLLPHPTFLFNSGEFLPSLACSISPPGKGKATAATLPCFRLSVSGDGRKAGGRRAGSATSGIRERKAEGGRAIIFLYQNPLVAHPLFIVPTDRAAGKTTHNVKNSKKGFNTALNQRLHVQP